MTILDRHCQSHLICRSPLHLQSPREESNHRVGQQKRDWHCLTGHFSYKLGYFELIYLATYFGRHTGRKEGKRKRRREGGRKNLMMKEKRGNGMLLTAGSLLTCPQWPRLNQAELRSLELNLVPLSEWQEFKHLNHHLPPSGAHINRKLKLEIELALKPRYGNVGCKPPRQCFNHGWLLYFHCFAVPWLRCLPLTSHQCYIDLKQSLGCTLIKIAFVTAHFLSYLIFCAIAMNSIIWYFVKTLISILLSSV